MPELLDSFAPDLNVTIRHACRDDLRKLEWFGLLTPFRDTIERAFERAEQGEVAFLVADATQFPVGQVCVDFVKQADEGTGVIWALRVIQPLQNLGIGTRLIHAAERIMAERGLDTAEIAVGKTNTSARRLYERLGYDVQREHISRWGYTTPDGGCQQVEDHEWILRKRLVP